MGVIAILNKEKKREIGLIIRAKNSIIRETKQKLIDVLYVTVRPGRSDIRFFIKGFSYLFIRIVTS